MRHRLQFVEAQETARTLDGVNGAKHAGQRVTILGIFLQADQLPVQPVKVLVALNQKILDDIAVITLTHGYWALCAA